MTVTKRIQRFINEVADVAMEEPERDKSLTREQALEEYTAQISEDDFYCVVNYAKLKGVEIPIALRGAVDANF